MNVLVYLDAETQLDLLVLFKFKKFRKSFQIFLV